MHQAPASDRIIRPCICLRRVHQAATGNGRIKERRSAPGSLQLNLRARHRYLGPAPPDVNIAPALHPPDVWHLLQGTLRRDPCASSLLRLTRHPPAPPSRGTNCLVKAFPDISCFQNSSDFQLEATRAEPPLRPSARHQPHGLIAWRKKLESPTSARGRPLVLARRETLVDWTDFVNLKRMSPDFGGDRVHD